MKWLFILALASIVGVSTSPAAEARLAGQSVYVRLLAETAHVSAAYQFADSNSDNGKVLHFAVFSSASDALSVLSAARFDIEVAGRKAGQPVPSSPRRVVKNLPAGLSVFWYSVSLDDLVDEIELAAKDRPLVVKVSYVQPLFGRLFHYLPSIPGDVQTSESRSWSHHLFARSAVRTIKLRSRSSDAETLGDGLMVYLRDGEVVVVE